MIEAKKLGDAKQFEKAIVLYEKELALHPEKKVIYQDIAVCYFSLNKSETAISYLLKIVNEPTLNDGKTEYLLSGCYYKMQDKTNACNYLSIAVNKNYPGTTDLFNKLCK
jgi:tetratricopeptide (TPR) repeat protein